MSKIGEEVEVLTRLTTGNAESMLPQDTVVGMIEDIAQKEEYSVWNMK